MKTMDEQRDEAAQESLTAEQSYMKKIQSNFFKAGWNARDALDE